MNSLKIRFLHGLWWFKRQGKPCLPEGLGGTCDPPEKRGRKWIYVHPELTGIEELETILHEFGHAADPQASEETIEERASEAAKLLWTLGYRKDC